MSEQRDPRTYAIIGAALEVHRLLGPGFLEAVYQEALAIELEIRQIPFRSEVALPLTYKGQRLHASYKVDFVCYDELIVETKALKQLSGTEEAQVLNYLKAMQQTVGLLLNFGSASLEHRRFISSHQ